MDGPQIPSLKHNPKSDGIRRCGLGTGLSQEEGDHCEWVDLGGLLICESTAKRHCPGTRECSPETLSCQNLDARLAQLQNGSVKLISTLENSCHSVTDSKKTDSLLQLLTSTPEQSGGWLGKGIPQAHCMCASLPVSLYTLTSTPVLWLVDKGECEAGKANFRQNVSAYSSSPTSLGSTFNLWTWR